MRFALFAKDKPNSLELRKANREAHLAYVKETGVAEMGGPLLDEDGNMCGSLAVLEFDTIEQAREWAKNDPYAKAGLFESVEISAWKKVFG